MAIEVEDRDAFVEAIRQALYASKIIAYTQGFMQMQAASDQYSRWLKFTGPAVLLALDP